MIAFVAEQRDDIGAQPVSRHLTIARSTCYDHLAERPNPDLSSDRAKRDTALKLEIERAWGKNHEVYGARKAFTIGLKRMPGLFSTPSNKAVRQRQPKAGLAHHSDRGSQYLSIQHTERFAETRIEPSAGGVGDSYDDALAETINGFFKAERIHLRRSCRSFDAVK